MRATTIPAQEVHGICKIGRRYPGAVKWEQNIPQGGEDIYIYIFKQIKLGKMYRRKRRLTIQYMASKIVMKEENQGGKL